MRVVGVIDLMGGVVVRGVAGRREDYRPVVSRLSPSAEPAAVAGAFVRDLGLEEVYLADLDAIAGAPPAWEVYAAVRAEGARLWVDAGVRQPERALELAGAGVESVVVGLETVAGLDVLERLAARLGERLVFSLDLRDGRPLGALPGQPEQLAAAAVARGVRRLLVLDLARVGVEAGPGTEELCARLTTAHPGVEVAAGGGVRGRADLERLKMAGVSAALVASALHEGRLTRADLVGL
jgi:phosphoribosylformimino-5-aminoimidazole carboxamide ribotide isomerase